MFLATGGDVKLALALSVSSQKSLASILGLNEATTLANYQRHALGCLQTAFAADAGCFFTYGDRSENDEAAHCTVGADTSLHMDFEAFVSENLDGETGPLYQAHYGSIDPFAKALAGLGAQIAPLATSGEALFEASSTWRDSEFYADFMRPRNVHHLLCLRLVDGRRVSGLISLYRAARRPRFDERALAEAQLFAPVLTSGLALTRASWHLAGCRTLIGAFEQMAPDRGVLLVDPDGRWRAASPRLERWLSYGDAANLARFRAQLTVYVASMTTNSANSFGLQTLRDGTGRLLTLRLLAGHDDAWVGSGRLFVLEAVEREDVFARNARAAGLSVRQRQIAALLLEGLSSGEIAERLCVSPATVNNHLRAIYSRVGVSSRGKLIAKMTSGH